MSKYRMLKCSICDGFGLVKRTEKDICNHCKDSTINGCCFCEFKLYRGQYKECSECLGIGEHWIDKETNKKVLVWCLSK
jgi:hypothetical protein